MKKIGLLLPLLVLLTGCTTFKKSQRMDLSPFAEYTVNLASDIEFGMTNGSKVHYLMDYRGDPQVLEHKAKWKYVRMLVRAIVAYSVEVTTLGGSKLPEAERNEEFAKFLDRTGPSLHPGISGHHPLFGSGSGFAPGGRSRPDHFFDALGSAQPIIDEIARLSELIFDELQDSLDQTADHLRARVEEENADVKFVRARLKKAQRRLVDSVIILGRIRGGEEDLWPELLANEPQLRDFIPQDRKPTAADMQIVEDRLFFLMDKIMDFKLQFAPDMEYYRNQVLELDELYKSLMMHVKKSRVTVIVWARAHRDLARGITDPAKIDIFDITKKAVKAAM